MVKVDAPRKWALGSERLPTLVLILALSLACTSWPHEAHAAPATEPALGNNGSRDADDESRGTTAPHEIEFISPTRYMVDGESLPWSMTKPLLYESPNASNHIRRGKSMEIAGVVMGITAAVFGLIAIDLTAQMDCDYWDYQIECHGVGGPGVAFGLATVLPLATTGTILFFSGRARRLKAVRSYELDPYWERR